MNIQQQAKKMQFDLISDLNIESWTPSQQIQWQGLGTSLIAVVLGNTSRSLNKSYQNLLEISKHYKHVICVEGTHEHDSTEINQTRNTIKEKLSKYKNITYLYRNTVILDSTAFIGSHGWYSFNFCEPYMSKQQCFHELIDRGHAQDQLFNQWEMAIEDANYIRSAVEHCHREPSVKEIVICTHTAPLRELITAPILYEDYADLGASGSSFLSEIANGNVSNKVKIWTFAQNLKSVDTVINGIRYVNNPRGTLHTAGNSIYYPLMITN